MLLYLLPMLIFSIVIPACKDRFYNSETTSSPSPSPKNLVTIHIKSAPVSQPIIFASVTSHGECRGGNPKYRVPNRDNRDNRDWQTGMPLPDLKVDTTVKRVCIGGMAGGGHGGGQDLAYWDLPSGLKGGETLIIEGNKIFLSSASK